MENSRIFVLTGPESSGKSTLATQLSDYFQAPFVPEVSRDYLNDKLSSDPTFTYQQSDLIEIAKQQHQQETVLLPFLPELIICDTDLLVLMIWSEVKYGECDPWITKTFEESLASNNPRHYFLCDYNIPWQNDPLRENPNNRQDLYALYLSKIEHYKLDYSIIKGNQQQRFQQALDKHQTLY